MVKQAAENKAFVIALRQTLDNGEAEAIALATEFRAGSPAPSLWLPMSHLQSYSNQLPCNTALQNAS